MSMTLLLHLLHYLASSEKLTLCLLSVLFLTSTSLMQNCAQRFLASRLLLITQLLLSASTQMGGSQSSYQPKRKVVLRTSALNSASVIKVNTSGNNLLLQQQP
jgi:hypothetical protein